MADKPLKPKEMALDGRLITAVDPVMIGSDFQELKNLRYTDTNPRAIKGMSKINTTALSTHPKVRSGFHFKKEQPAESHVLVQGFNSGETESKVFQNTTAIPSAGDFSGTALHTDSGTGIGRFSDAINGNVAYCNGEETLIWGGDEHFSSGFVNYDPDGTWIKDYTTQVQNTLTDSDNIATLTKISGDLPSNTGLLLHLDNNVTDSSASTHTVTNNNVTFTTTAKFGTHAAVFNGSNAYLTVPDHADFDFSGRDWSIDLRFKLSGTTNRVLFSQATDANNYLKIQVTAFHQVRVFYAIASTTYSLSIPTGKLMFDTDHFHHLEVSQDGDNWYIYVDGRLEALASSANTLPNFTGDVHIGVFYDGSTYDDYHDGDIDEFRLGKSHLHDNEFTPREVPYGTAATYINLGAVRPIKGIDIDIETANTTAGTANVLKWEKQTSDVGSTPENTATFAFWKNLTNVSDGTSSGGITLAQDGSIAFDDETSSPKFYNNTHLYWYLLVFSETDNTTTISNVTLDMSMQSVKDLWDGEMRSPLYFEINTGSQAYDNTVNVFEETYTSTNSATYSDLSGLAANSYLLAGFAEQMTAINLRFIAERVNLAFGKVMLIWYWQGERWSSLTLTQEGTREGTIPLNNSGVISWTPPGKGAEHKQEINGRPPLYYYKFEISTALTSGTDAVSLYYVGGISAQRQIDGYKFPLLSHNRLMLCSNQDDKKNTVLIGAPNTNSVFNGNSYREISFGNDDELVAGLEIYGQFSSSLYNLTLLCKKAESWLLSEQENSFEWYRVSPTIGCTAPLTMTAIHTTPTEERPAISGAIFQSTDAIYLFDGRDFYPVHRDIEDVFTRLNTSYIDKSEGFLDETNQEWHWLITTGVSTTHNEEWVYDLKRDKWYQIDRTAYLQTGFKVEDTNGNFYTYGTLDTGFMERLENGTTFDGSDMTFSIWSGDVALTGSGLYETQIRAIHLLAKSKNTTTNSISVTYYGDGTTTGTSLIAISPANTNGRLISKVKSVNTGKHVYHSIKLSMTTNDEATGFEPLRLGVFYKDMGEHKGIKNA
jgi:hypothetical protein